MVNEYRRRGAMEESARNGGHTISKEGVLWRGVKHVEINKDCTYIDVKRSYLT